MDLRDAYALAEHLLARHGLDDWEVAYDSAKRRAGVCRYDVRTIGLSAPLTTLHTFDEVRDTILHEIAHALAGPEHGHDAYWRRLAMSIGSSGERCMSTQSARVEPAWLGVCSAGHVQERHKRPERVITCGTCSNRFDLTHLYEWTHHGRPAQMHPNYTVELERLRAGKYVVLLPVGSKARITVAGDFQGTVGRIVKRGRTSYHLRAGRQVVRVPFAHVEPARR